MSDTSSVPTAPPAAAATVAELTARLDELMTSDSLRLGRRLGGLRRISDKGKRAKALADLEVQVDRARRRVDQRAQAVPEITFPPELPVSDRVDDLAAAIRTTRSSSSPARQVPGSPPSCRRSACPSAAVFAV